MLTNCNTATPTRWREREESGDRRKSSCLMPKLMHDTAAPFAPCVGVCLYVSVCVWGSCCCTHFNYEPDYNVSRPVGGKGRERETVREG